MKEKVYFLKLANAPYRFEQYLCVSVDGFEELWLDYTYSIDKSITSFLLNIYPDLFETFSDAREVAEKIRARVKENLPKHMTLSEFKEIFESELP